MVVELLFGEPLFSGTSESDQLVKMCDVLGLPPVEILERAHPTKLERTFVKVRRGQYRLVESKERVKRKTLTEMIKTRVQSDGAYATDYFHFLDWIERMLVFNPEERMTPREALDHPFLRPSVSTAVNTDYARMGGLAAGVD